MKKKIFLIALIVCILGSSPIVWPAPSKRLYEENKILFEYDLSDPQDIQIQTYYELSAFHQISLSYPSPKGGRVPATIFTPGGEGPYPAILMLHGMPGNRSHMNSLALHYVRSGAVVMTIDAPLARRSGPSVYFDTRDRLEQIQLIQDLRRGIDLLVARPDVDPYQLAYVGLSYGAAMGGLLAGVEDRIDAYVLMVGDGGLVSHFTGPDDMFGTYRMDLDREQRKTWKKAMWPIEPIHYIGQTEGAILYQSARNDGAISLLDRFRYHWAGDQPKEVIWYDSDHWPLPEWYLDDQAAWLSQFIEISVDDAPNSFMN